MKTILLIVATCLLYGCCPKVTTEYIIRTDTVKVVVPYYLDTLVLDTRGGQPTDTALTASGKKVQLIYLTDPKDSLEVRRLREILKNLRGKLLAGRKVDTVYYPYLDTTAIIHKELPSEPSWLERQIWKLLIFGALFVGLIVAFRKAIQ